ncbi:hypothetical protein N0438_22245, partial [Pseudomonas aeruginosa]|nr:hypothetical protein [Pseudomonas aeruginosa]
MDEFSGSLIDHLGIGVSDISHARAFYEQALKPLGITLLASIEATPPQSASRRLGFGSSGKPFLWVHATTSPSIGAHITLIGNRLANSPLSTQTSSDKNGWKTKPCP